MIRPNIRKATTLLLLFLLFSATGKASAASLSFYQQQVYKAYISDDMELWKSTMEQMNSEINISDKFLLHLTITQYGYIGYLIGNKQKDTAKELLDNTRKNAKKLSKTHYNTEAYALMAGLNGYEIGLAKHKAPFLGKKSEQFIDKSLDISKVNPMAWTEKGNIYYHMPGFFGGSYEKAIDYYTKAVRYFNKTPYLPQWLKLNALVWLGKSYEANGQLNKALQTYKKALETEPDFNWVKNDLYPKLLNKM